MPCPRCEAFTEVMPGEYPDDCAAAFPPADPAALTGIGARRHAMALRAGQDAVAGWVTRLFGRGTCAGCETVFDLADSAARVCGLVRERRAGVRWGPGGRPGPRPSPEGGARPGGAGKLQPGRARVLPRARVNRSAGR
ncbi:hypothetical protein AQJ64_11720 [Streptomyces griseoruber]|uniref:Uncharacterized protein n=1 Tax=Streptomyces griseoruber TaxID=1943 RepID=A0A101T441_9ACTN|nr:hypothetical protein AQJ64_11720 [Streptomyces griseoruber]